jgi:hypothetical protein
MNAEFRRAERCSFNQRKRKIKCQMSNPAHDGKSTWKPVYICDDCQDRQDIDIAQEQDQN